MLWMAFLQSFLVKQKFLEICLFLHAFRVTQTAKFFLECSFNSPALPNTALTLLLFSASPGEVWRQEPHSESLSFDSEHLPNNIQTLNIGGSGTTSVSFIVGT